MKNVPFPMVCYFLKENRLRIQRKKELVRRRKSVFDRPSYSYDDDEREIEAARNREAEAKAEAEAEPGEGDDISDGSSSGSDVFRQLEPDLRERGVSQVAGKVLLFGALGSLAAAVLLGFRSS